MEIGFAFFHPVHEIVQHHAMQLGVRHAVTNGTWAGCNSYAKEWDYMPLLKTKLSMNEFDMYWKVWVLLMQQNWAQVKKRKQLFIS